MKEIEKNQIVINELFGDREFPEEVVENRLLDWDKAFTCIFYNKKSIALEERGESVYKTIREKNEDFLKGFKESLEKMCQNG